MQLFEIAPAFAALLLLGIFLGRKCGLPSALTPLVSLSLAALWLTGAGVAGVLQRGGYVFMALCGILGIWALLPVTGESKAEVYAALKKNISPALCLFWALSAALAIYFAVRQPLFADFDEFSFWGTAAKLTSTNNTLYTTAAIGWAWQATQNPGLVLLSYFVQFFGSFAPWKTFLAYDMLLFACFAAVLGRLKWQQYALAVPAAAILWCVPWFFTTYNRTIYNAISTVYMSSYGDIPAGVVFGGAVACWLWLRGDTGANSRTKWFMLPVLVLCGNIKSNTFVLSLVAAGLVAADHFLFPAEKPWKKGVFGRFGFGAACLAAPVALYMAWGRYIGGLVAKNAASGGMGETSQDIVSVAISGVRVLLGLPVGTYYTERMGRLHQAAADMTHAFYSFEDGKLCMLGPGVMLVVLIFAVFAMAVFFAKAQRLRFTVMGLLSAGGFVGYNFMLVLSYAFIFKESQCADLVDYNRYLYTYYIGWFLLALACLVFALKERTGLLAAVGRGGVLLLAAAMLLRVNQLVLPQMSVLGFSANYFADQRMEQRRADAAAAAVEPGSRIFFVSQGDNGYRWFAYCYDFLPLIVDYSGNTEQGGGGGTFGLPELRPGEEDHNRWLYYHPYTAKEWRDEVLKSGCQYLFLDEIDDIFIESYGQLFTDELSAARGGETLLYRVSDSGFAPVAMEVPQ